MRLLDIITEADYTIIRMHTHTTMERKTYYLFGETNYYQAARNAKFKHRRRIACRFFDGTAEQASLKLMGYLTDECDDYYWSDDAKSITYGNAVIFTLGEMSYHDDGYTWEFISADEMNEEDARLAHQMSLLSDADEAMLKDKYDLNGQD
jgi:hypothetical protein